MAESRSPMLYVGIDPGKGGGLAALEWDGKVSLLAKMPDTPAAVVELLLGIPERSVVVLERVHSSPQMGVRSAFTFGRGLGVLEGVLAAFNLRVEDVTPQRWQTALGCMSGGDKNVTKRRAEGLFPGARITHATADALLLAEYCRRLEAGMSATLETRRRR